jgi:hypothetical protein
MALPGRHRRYGEYGGRVQARIHQQYLCIFSFSVPSNWKSEKRARVLIVQTAG